MKNAIRLLVVFLFPICATAQLGFSHEIGAFTGPLAFMGDYGERYDLDTDLGNTGIAIGLVHYMNFSYKADCNCYARETYWNDHFKVRSELLYHYTKLDHLGPEADKDSFAGLTLRSMHGSVSVLEVGVGLEYYPRSLRDFAAGAFQFAPYGMIGAHFVTSKPDAYSDLGPLSNNLYVFDEFEGGIDLSRQNTWAVVAVAGTRYKLDVVSDLLGEIRWEYYFSNTVEGLNHDRPQNKFNDWIFTINFGYVYYLDF